ncbi:hypothetical protein TNCV_1189701 [Trichonephila clavipes]|nr:hypothetical protein TNCV_1189701 [Trichonephila clavipes]
MVRPVVKVLDHGWRVMSSSRVPLKTRRVGKRCKLNMLRAQTSSRWCGVVVRNGGVPAQEITNSTSLPKKYYGRKDRLRVKGKTIKNSKWIQLTLAANMVVKFVINSTKD